jgi:hypothetical protein
VEGCIFIPYGEKLAPPDERRRKSFSVHTPPGHTLFFFRSQVLPSCLFYTVSFTIINAAVVPLSLFANNEEQPTNMAISLLFWMALMMASQVISWTYIVKASSSSSASSSLSTAAAAGSLYTAVWQLSLFYVAWALYKKIFLSDANEMGHISFGLLAVTTYLKWKWPAIVANILLIANFLFAVSILASFPPSELAHLVKNDDSALGIVWAYTFYAYIGSSVCLWSFALYKLWQLPAPGTTSLSSPYTTLPTATTY